MMSFIKVQSVHVELKDKDRNNHNRIISFHCERTSVHNYSDLFLNVYNDYIEVTHRYDSFTGVEEKPVVRADTTVYRLEDMWSYSFETIEEKEAQTSF